MTPIRLDLVALARLGAWYPRDATDALAWMGFAEAVIQALGSSCRLVADSLDEVRRVFSAIQDCSKRVSTAIDGGRFDSRVARMGVQIEDLQKWTSPVVGAAAGIDVVHLLSGDDEISGESLLTACHELVGLVGQGFHHVNGSRFGMEKSLKRSLELLGAASEQVFIVDPYAWRALDQPGDWGHTPADPSAAYTSISFVVKALTSRSEGQLKRLHLVVVEPEGEKGLRPDGEFRLRIANNFHSLVLDCASCGDPPEVLVTWHLRNPDGSLKRRFRDRLHARFVVSEVAGLGFDPGVESIFRPGGFNKPPVFSERLLVRMMRAEEKEMVSRASRVLEGKDHVITCPGGGVQ